VPVDTVPKRKMVKSLIRKFHEADRVCNRKQNRSPMVLNDDKLEDIRRLQSTSKSPIKLSQYVIRQGKVRCKLLN